MDDKKPVHVPGWVRDDPEVLRDWLAIDWEAEARLFDELGGRQTQTVFTGRPKAPKTAREVKNTCHPCRTQPFRGGYWHQDLPERHHAMAASCVLYVSFNGSAAHRLRRHSAH